MAGGAAASGAAGGASVFVSAPPRGRLQRVGTCKQKINCLCRWSESCWRPGRRSSSSTSVELVTCAVTSAELRASLSLEASFPARVSGPTGSSGSSPPPSGSISPLMSGNTCCVLGRDHRGQRPTNEAPLSPASKTPLGQVQQLALCLLPAAEAPADSGEEENQGWLRATSLCCAPCDITKG